MGLGIQRDRSLGGITNMTFSGMLWTIVWVSNGIPSFALHRSDYMRYHISLLLASHNTASCSQTPIIIPADYYP